MALNQTDTSSDQPEVTRSRFALYEEFLRRPCINADINSATEATREVANPDFEVLGTNAASADVAFYAEGGIAVSTHGGTTDSTIILPHLDTNQTAWSGVTWGTDQETWWGCQIKTAAALTNTTIWCGLKLTNTPTVTTDNDQVFFKYVNGTDTNWQCIYSIGNTDTTVDSGVAVAAATDYKFEVRINASRAATFLINGVVVGTSTALTDAVDLIPYIGVLSATDATAKTIYVRAEWISRKYA
jgi:hypothetical protein